MVDDIDTDEDPLEMETEDPNFFEDFLEEDDEDNT